MAMLTIGQQDIKWGKRKQKDTNCLGLIGTRLITRTGYVPDMSLKLITKIGNLDAFRQQLHEALDQDFEVSENR